MQVGLVHRLRLLCNAATHEGTHYEGSDQGTHYEGTDQGTHCAGQETGRGIRHSHLLVLLLDNLLVLFSGNHKSIVVIDNISNV